MKNFTALKAQRFFALSFDALFAYGDAAGTPKWALKDFACGLSPSVFTAKICRPLGVQFYRCGIGFFSGGIGALFLSGGKLF